MWFPAVLPFVLASELLLVAASPQNIKRQAGTGQPIDSTGKGGPILGGTNKPIDLQNPDNLGGQPTDSGNVPNFKWSFSDSRTRILKGGWVREQVITDLPQSHDIAAAQMHLKKGAMREMHWHRVAEWGVVYNGSVIISAIDETGRFEVATLNYGDIWYFPKGAPHAIQGVEEENEFLLAFDEADFDRVGTTFMVDDWIAHTPKRILAKNFGVNASFFDNVPTPDPYFLNGPVSTSTVSGSSAGGASGASSFVYRTLQHPGEKVPGGGGKFWKIDSTNFPISKTIASTFVTLKPKALREMHWHPNAEEWLYFHKGTARATVFIGSGSARTFDFSAGDTAAFPDNSGHYIENTSETEDLVFFEIYKSDRVADISLSQWLALTPADMVAQTMNVPVSFVEQLKKEKQIMLP